MSNDEAAIRAKSALVEGVRDRLMKQYGARAEWTPGAGHTEAVGLGGGAVGLRRKSFDEPVNLRGFVFWKDTCAYPPRSKEDVLRDVHSAVRAHPQAQGTTDRSERLEVQVGGEKYDVSTYVDPLYAGKVSVWFSRVAA